VPAAPPDPAPSAEPDAAPEDQGAGQGPRQPVRTAQQIEAVVRATKAANPGWSQRQIAEAAATSPSTVRRILGRDRAVDLTHVEPVDGRQPELAATVAAGEE
jgi:hypothetical protein